MTDSNLYKKMCYNNIRTYVQNYIGDLSVGYYKSCVEKKKPVQRIYYKRTVFVL